jgi:polysaccharide export outer membrane protein
MRTAILPAILAVAALTVLPALGQKNKKAASAKPAASAADQDRAGNPQDADSTQDFVIGAEDVLSISVYDQPQFTVLSQSVRPDGIISMPLVGEVKATGKTPRQLETEIAKTLSDQYLRTTPRVMVTINTVKSRYFLIEGGVNKPGRYDLLVPTTIIQALVNAGGFHEFANTKKINLLREGKVFVVFNFNDAIKGKHPEQNVYLKHGDLIAVKE